MTIVKICGITNLKDALLSIEAGADALGFNFYAQSPRFINPQSARRIIQQLPASVLTVGVFVNEESPHAVESIARDAGVAAVQLHGDESAAFCRDLSKLFVIKALAVDATFNPHMATEYEVDAILLDAFDRKLRGGTGQVIDWSLASKTRESVPKLFLAGGLSAENVTRAIAEVRPYGVDACSAVEVEPGKKDGLRVREFVKAARRQV